MLFHVLFCLVFLLLSLFTVYVHLLFCHCECNDIFFSPVRDLISGAIMAATSVPQLIAYAETAGYAGYRGLATAGPPLLVWGLGKFTF